MLKFDRRLIKNFDWITLLTVIFIAVIGIMTIYSATRPSLETGTHPDFYLKQMLWLFLSIIALFVVISIDYIWFYRLSYLMYGIGIILLIITSLFGSTNMGAQRWINLGFISFQPSEFFRLIFLLAFSSYLVSLGKNKKSNISIGGIFVFAIVPMILIISQPDLGTGILILSLFCVLLISKGISRKIIIITVLIGVISIPFLGHIVWNGLKDYQKNRLIAFINSDIDPKGIGYHITQSKITIGSGGFFGKGYLKGTQGPLRFLPEKHTDFIFSVFAEERGLIGSFFLLLIYLIFFIRGLDTANKAKDEFGRLVALGITIMFFIYFFVNIGMTVGIMPVVGVPLPFMSYGGTALLSNFIAVGILINIRMRRFELFYP